MSEILDKSSIENKTLKKVERPFADIQAEQGKRHQKYQELLSSNLIKEQQE